MNDQRDAGRYMDNVTPENSQNPYKDCMTTWAEPTMKLTDHNQSQKCDCRLCKTRRKYFKAINGLPPKSKAWMVAFFDCFCETSAELDMLKAINNQ